MMQLVTLRVLVLMILMLMVVWYPLLLLFDSLRREPRFCCGYCFIHAMNFGTAASGFAAAGFADRCC